MKKGIKTVAMLAVLCLAGTACQKEQVVEPTNLPKSVETAYAVTYSVDGVQYSITVYGDLALYNLISGLLDLTQGGSVVTVQASDASIVGDARDTVTYTSKDKDDATAWCVKKVKDGYSVSMREDPVQGWICTATK